MSANVTPTLADKLSGYLHQSALHALLEAVCERLRDQDLISLLEVRVLPEYHADMHNSLNQVLNKKLSVLVVVGFERINKGDASVSVYMKDMRLSVDVYENVLINQSASGTRTSALSLAEAAAVHLHEWQPEKTAVLVNPSSIKLAQQGTLQMNREQSELKSGVVCYSVALTTGGCLSAQLRCANVLKTGPNTAVALSCATAGVQIFYTTDGSVPSADNGEVYESAFNASPATVIKAVAIKEAFIDSPISTFNL